jgi:hypothetical protein
MKDLYWCPKDQMWLNDKTYMGYFHVSCSTVRSTGIECNIVADRLCHHYIKLLTHFRFPFQIGKVCISIMRPKNLCNVVSIVISPHYSSFLIHVHLIISAFLNFILRSYLLQYFLLRQIPSEEFLPHTDFFWNTHWQGNEFNHVWMTHEVRWNETLSSGTDIMLTYFNRSADIQ